MRINYFISILAGSIFFDCSHSKPLPPNLVFEDQIWMSKNLDVDKFQNGDLIIESKTKEDWVRACENHKPTWSNFENEKANGRKYGKLYNWYVITDPRGISPKGWHIPNSVEWIKLIDFMGGMEKGGKRMRKKEFKNRNEIQFGFCAEAGGYRDTTGNFVGLGYYRNWWVLDTNSTEAPIISMSPDKNSIFMNSVPTGMGIAIRCIKD